MHISVLLHDFFDEEGGSSQEGVLFLEGLVDIVVDAVHVVLSLPHETIDLRAFVQKLDGIEP